jgi:hypothetical protein
VNPSVTAVFQGSTLRLANPGQCGPEHCFMLKKEGLFTPLRLLVISGLLVSLTISAWCCRDSCHWKGDALDLIKDTVLLLRYHDGLQSARPGGRFPLLQTLPVGIMTRLKMKVVEQLDFLSTLNGLSLSLSLVWGGFALRGRGRFAPLLFISALLLSPLLWFSRSGFGEMLAAFCTLGLVISCCLDLSWLMIMIFMILAGISKETAAPFLLLLGACASAIRKTRRSETDSCPTLLARPRYWPLVCGALTAVALNSGLNWIRFGSTLNYFYLRPELVVHDWPTWANFFAAIWVAPNGGLAFFWPASVLILLVVEAGVVSRRLLSRGSSPGGRWRSSLPLLGVIVTLAGITATLASWHAPLGWDAWGPRLLLPWIPASLFLVLFAYGGDVDRAMQFLERRPVLWVLALGTVATLSIPQTFALFQPQMCWSWFQWKPSPEFPRQRSVLHDPEYFYRSEKHDMWRREWIMWPAYTYRPLTKEQGIAIADSFALAVLLPLLAGARTRGVSAVCQDTKGRGSSGAERQLGAAAPFEQT